MIVIKSWWINIFLMRKKNNNNVGVSKTGGDVLNELIDSWNRCVIQTPELPIAIVA